MKGTLVALLIASVLALEPAVASSAAPNGRVAELAVDARGRATVLLATPAGTRPVVVRLGAGGSLDRSFSGRGVLRPLSARAAVAGIRLLTRDAVRYRTLFSNREGAHSAIGQPAVAGRDW